MDRRDLLAPKLFFKFEFFGTRCAGFLAPSVSFAKVQKNAANHKMCSPDQLAKTLRRSLWARYWWCTRWLLCLCWQSYQLRNFETGKIRRRHAFGNARGGRGRFNRKSDLFPRDQRERKKRARRARRSRRTARRRNLGSRLPAIYDGQRSWRY